MQITNSFSERESAHSRLDFINNITSWTRQLSLSGDTIPLLLSIIVGLITGASAFILIRLIHYIAELTGMLRLNYGVGVGIGAMMLAGLITGAIISRFASEAKGHGVPEVMEAIALNRGRIRPIVAVAKVIASAITIGAGGSAGREGPVVQVGSTLGSTLGQWVNLSDEQIRMLVASGAAAGIAATFNAPIAGSLFALEIILGRFGNRYLGIVITASVAANVVSRALLGDAPAFEIPVYSLNSALELPLYALMAFLCALVAIAFIRLLYGAEYLFDGLRLSLPLVTAIGMGLTGLIGLMRPQVMGPGLEFIEQAIADDMSLDIDLMFGMLCLKLLATTFTLGSGNSGGVFAPALFMGAMLGGVIGHLGIQVFPGIVVDPGAFAIVGMAAVFAGAARAPLTAIVIVLEMSNDYRLILPLLMCVGISTLLCDVLHPDSIYTRKLTLRGIRLESGQDVDVLQGVKVAEVMDKEYETVQATTELQDILPRFTLTHTHGFPIVDEHSQLRGIITLTDVERVVEAGSADTLSVLDIGTTKDLITVYPDDPIYVALRRMNSHGVGRLPVVARKDDKTYLGMIRRADVLRAYDIGITRKAVEQHRHRLELRDIDENEFLEIIAEPDSPMVGRTLAEFPYSDYCLLVAIRRGGYTMIAHGNTRIELGDRITAYVKPTAYGKVVSLFKSGNEWPEILPSEAS